MLNLILLAIILPFVNGYDNLITNDPNICGDHFCSTPAEKNHMLINQKFLQMEKNPIFESTRPNIGFNLVTPTGGEIDNIIFSDANFTLLKNNVGVFTVPLNSIHTTTAKPTIGYCPIAKTIHEHEGDYDNLPVGNSTIFQWTIPPKWCDVELYPQPIPIPEFGSIMPFMFMASMMGVIVLAYMRINKT